MLPFHDVSHHLSGLWLLIRGDDLGKSMSRYLVDQIERNDSLTVCRNAEVVELGQAAAVG